MSLRSVVGAGRVAVLFALAACVEVDTADGEPVADEDDESVGEAQDALFVCHTYEVDPRYGDNDWAGGCNGWFCSSSSTGTWNFVPTSIGYLNDLRYTSS